jgi:hypothetical protein
MAPDKVINPQATKNPENHEQRVKKMRKMMAELATTARIVRDKQVTHGCPDYEN